MGDVVPFPAPNRDVFIDGRGEGRVLRVSWHHSENMVVLSMWEWDHCRATFRLAAADVPDLIGLLSAGLHGPAAAAQQSAALPGGPVPAADTPPDTARFDAYPPTVGGPPSHPPFDGEPMAAEAHLPASRFGVDPCFDRGVDHDARLDGGPRFEDDPSFAAETRVVAPPAFGDQGGQPPFDPRPAFDAADSRPAGGQPGDTPSPHGEYGGGDAGYTDQARYQPGQRAVDPGAYDDLWTPRRQPPSQPEPASRYPDFRPEIGTHEQDYPPADHPRPPMPAAGRSAAAPPGGSERPAEDAPPYEHHAAAYSGSSYPDSGYPDHAHPDSGYPHGGRGYEYNAVDYERRPERFGFPDFSAEPPRYADPAYAAGGPPQAPPAPAYNGYPGAPDGQAANQRQPEPWEWDGSAWGGDSWGGEPRHSHGSGPDAVDLEATQFHPGPDVDAAPDYPPPEFTGGASRHDLAFASDDSQFASGARRRRPPEASYTGYGDDYRR